MDRKSKALMVKLLKGDISYAAAQKALADPVAHSLQVRFAPGKTNYRWWGKVKTPRMTVAYCWSCHRNVAVYFLGWREVYNDRGIPGYTRDQYVARKSKKRLSLLQKRRHMALLEQGGIRVKR